MPSHVAPENFVGQRHTKLPSSPKRHVPPLLHGFGIQAFTVSVRSMYKRKVYHVRNEISYGLRLMQTYIWSTYLERSLTSRYQGSRSYGTRQFLLIKMAIYIVKRWKKSIGCFVPDFNHAQESHTCQCFRFFFLPYLRDHDVLRSRNFATMATWGDNFSSETL